MDGQWKVNSRHAMRGVFVKFEITRTSFLIHFLVYEKQLREKTSGTDTK